MRSFGSIARSEFFERRNPSLFFLAWQRACSLSLHFDSNRCRKIGGENVHTA